MRPRVGSTSGQVIMNLERNKNEQTEWRLYVVEEYIWYRVTDIFVSELIFMFVSDVIFS
jgi:hypothetical protein